MFIQEITAKAADREGLKRQMDLWDKEIRPGAEGFLGSTSGISEEGRVILLARFESEEAARRNSERPEQGAWWAETEKMLEEPKFQDSVDVITMQGGGSDDAGFVQVMRGTVSDPGIVDEMRGRADEFAAMMAQHRPDVLGDATAVHADGTFTNAIYFTSEADARAGEAKEPSPEVQAMFGSFMTAFAVDEWIDLKEPRLA